jgi:hypothetical protein
MKLVAALTLTLAVPACFAAGTDRMIATRAAADFELTADPNAPPWKNVKGVWAEVDPFGKKVAAHHRFETRVRWTPEYLYFLFICPYDELNLKPNPVTSKETNKLWEWDVAEVFIGADFNNIHRYREYQVSPQGEWVDLDIDRKNPKPEGGWLWNSGFEVRAGIDSANKVWYGAMKIPAKSIDDGPVRAGKQYRMNVYRLAGKAPDRQSIMWTPTMNRSHHTPEQFGILVLSE